MEGGKERKRGERGTWMWERNIDCIPPICIPTGDWTYNLGMSPDQESNSTFWCMGQRSNRLSHLARVLLAFLYSEFHSEVLAGTLSLEHHWLLFHLFSSYLPDFSFPFPCGLPSSFLLYIRDLPLVSGLPDPLPTHSQLISSTLVKQTYGLN